MKGYFDIKSMNSNSYLTKMNNSKMVYPIVYNRLFSTVFSNCNVYVDITIFAVAIVTISSILSLLSDTTNSYGYTIYSYYCIIYNNYNIIIMCQKNLY